MFRRVALVIILLGSSVPAAAETPRVSMDRYGVFRVGMSELEAARIAGHQLVRDDRDGGETECFYASSPQLPEGVNLMFLDGRLARIDVSEPEVATLFGTKIGTTERQLKQMYGHRLSQEPHKYDWPIGHYFTLLSSDGSRGVRFETDGVRVTGYYAGTAEAIHLAEGCQ